MTAQENDSSAAYESAAVPDARVALCLSGGGFRAALFHLGAVRRLNELGVLGKVDLLSSVSGGSILAAHLATRMENWPSAGAAFEGWEDAVEAPFRMFVRNNIRTAAILKRFLLWNWFRPSTQVKSLQAKYYAKLTDRLLPELPQRPTFVFCGTDMVYGVSWVFERARVGSWRAGYLQPAPAWPVAAAVAASSCFPPVFSPLPVAMESGKTVTDGIGRPMPPWASLSVSDGGLYDNLGLQPAEAYGTVLVSDGGQPFVPTVPHGMFGRAKAYLAIAGKQAGAVRKRLLIRNFETKVRYGTYWGVGSAVTRYRSDAGPGYSKEFATEVIARIRTDMDAFSEAEIAVLINHGYLLANIAITVHASQLAPDPAAVSIPFPDWLDERQAGEALAESHQRRWLGRFR